MAERQKTSLVISFKSVTADETHSIAIENDDVKMAEVYGDGHTLMMGEIAYIKITTFPKDMVYEILSSGANITKEGAGVENVTDRLTFAIESETSLSKEPDSDSREDLGNGAWRTLPAVIVRWFGNQIAGFNNDGSKVTIPNLPDEPEKMIGICDASYITSYRKHGVGMKEMPADAADLEEYPLVVVVREIVQA